jgi:hypothetical protein
MGASTNHRTGKTARGVRLAWLGAALGCAATPPLPPGSLAETQLHGPCPAAGGCVTPLVCVGGADSGEEARCELGCSGSCPPPLTCMSRTDGQRGGVCEEAPPSPRPYGH